jgi:hypothetical protein
VTAADAREALESVIWRERGGNRQRGAQDVDRILAAADSYAYALAAEQAANAARASRLAGAEASAAEHRQRLEQATAERTGRTT